MKWLRILWMVFTTFLYEVFLFLPLFALGVILVPLFSGLTEEVNGKVMFKGFLNKLLWIWSNDEDGLAGDAPFHADNQGASLRQLIWRWYLRNPVDNLKYVPYLNPELKSNLPIQACGTAKNPWLEDSNPKCTNQWYVTWMFPYWGLYYYNYDAATNTYNKVYLGWEIQPQDAGEVVPGDKRANFKTVGFAWQIRYKHKL